MAAYYFTNSLAILSDALESIVNVLAGFIGLYSLYVAAKPQDEDHPYGHGKAEFVSAAVEGFLIIGAGILIFIQGIENLVNHKPISQLGIGLWLIGSTSVLNFIAGSICIVMGKRNKSMALQASGKHLLIDTYSTIAIIGGLFLVLLTHWIWVDTAIALTISIVILYNGYSIVRASLAGIMDEADISMLQKLIPVLNAQRHDNWIDLHNLRVIKYGRRLHVDAHLTVPWYLNIHEAHAEIDALKNVFETELGDVLELFVHTDGCLAFSCSICSKTTCQVRQMPFDKKVEWTLENIISNNKHNAPATVLISA
jgi:cation diffusion facilitator family transporter